jgi:hypothetical protein
MSVPLALGLVFNWDNSIAKHSIAVSLLSCHISAQLLQLLKGTVTLAKGILDLHAIERNVFDCWRNILPRYRHPCNSGLLSEDFPENLIDLQLIGWILNQQRIHIFVVNVVSDPKELLLLVGNR